jgi:putative FmdB family regulatory protein
MPTYEYECKKCGHRFELFQAITAEPAKSCPECKGAARRLLGGGAAVIVKGAGSHATDYRDGAPPCGRSRPCSADAPCAHKH